MSLLQKGRVNVANKINEKKILTERNLGENHPE